MQPALHTTHRMACMAWRPPPLLSCTHVACPPAPWQPAEWRSGVSKGAQAQAQVQAGHVTHGAAQAHEA